MKFAKEQRPATMDVLKLSPASLAVLSEVPRILAALAATEPDEPELAGIINEWLMAWESSKPGDVDSYAERHVAEVADKEMLALTGDSLVVAVAFAAQAKVAALKNDELEAWRLASVANHWCGVTRGLVFAGAKIDITKLAARRDVVRQLAIEAVAAKLAKDSDGKQAAKSKVKSDFWVWIAAKQRKDLSQWKDQKGREITSNAAFANEMLRRYPDLESTAVIAERWIPEWLKEGPSTGLD